MRINVLVNGANGRMGQQVVAAVSQDPELELVAATDKDDDLFNIIQSSKAQVVVDFTVASSAFENAATIIEANAHPVIGTSGFSKEQIEDLTQRCAKKQLGGIIAPNTSIGAVLMMKLATDAAHYFKEVEIIEMHHDKKQDAPSGTAMKTADMLSEVIEDKVMLAQKELIPHSRGAIHHNINIHAVRLPGLVAHQQVIFGGTGETLTLKHDSLSRECFMPGVLMACKKVVVLKELLYGLEQIL